MFARFALQIADEALRDLESCVQVAQTIHARAGTSCDQGELAAWMNQSATGGTFRTRISAAKLCGLIDSGQGRAALTQLGRDTLDGSGNERAASSGLPESRTTRRQL